MAGEGREETTQEPPPVDQPTDESPALSFDPGPQVVDTTAVEEPAEPGGAPEPSFETSGDAGTSPRDAQPAADSDQGRPEVAVLGAFAGGVVVAQILKRLGGRDE